MTNATQRLLPLWIAVFGEPPAVLLDAPAMIAILVETLPEPAPARLPATAPAKAAASLEP